MEKLVKLFKEYMFDVVKTQYRTFFMFCISVMQQNLRHSQTNIPVITNTNLILIRTIIILKIIKIKHFGWWCPTPRKVTVQVRAEAAACTKDTVLLRYFFTNNLTCNKMSAFTLELDKMSWYGFKHLLLLSYSSYFKSTQKSIACILFHCFEPTIKSELSVTVLGWNSRGKGSVKDYAPPETHYYHLFIRRGGHSCWFHCN